MNTNSWRTRALAASWCVALGVFVMLASDNTGIAQQAPAGQPAAAPAQGRQTGAGGGGQGQARGRGPAPVDTLGAGPWDLAAGRGTRLHVSVVTKGLDRPWGIAFLPDPSTPLGAGGMNALVTERPGRLRQIKNGVLDPTPIGPMPEMLATGLGGLLDVSLHPRFAQNRLIYLTYSKPGAKGPGDATTAVLRAKWDGGSTLTEVKDILVADAYHGGAGSPQGLGPASGSYGSRLAWDRAGFLYVSLGDRNYPPASQDPASHIGKILRIRDDGTVPADNPFVSRPGYKPEIYSLGHRNPLGLASTP